MEKYRELISSRARMYALNLINIILERYTDAKVYYNKVMRKIAISRPYCIVYISHENLEIYANDYDKGQKALLDILIGLECEGN